MPRKGFPALSGSRRASPPSGTCKGLRDTAIQDAKATLAKDDWPTSLACLRRADRYQRQADAMEHDQESKGARS